MIETGTTLQQRYRIDKQIGQGGMGAVYVATDERFGSKVAIKETLCMDDNFRKAIEREARLLNNLKHSALPRVSDHFEESNGQFLVMEYIPGDDLGSVLMPGDNKFTVEQILKWADQLLDALDYLHSQENPVIHRDIKPQNLKLTSRGDVILLDFGLAKGNPTDASHQTAAKSIFGYSRNYASLEQIQGTGTDPRSDLYSLAATLYHLLTNASPEDALTRAMAVLSQKPDPLVPANSLNPVIPRGVAGVLQKAMSLNADERPASASEMRQMLRESENYAYLADPVTVASPAGNTVAFGQETKLMPGHTRVGDVNQTDVKTEILPSSSSEETALHPGPAGHAATNAVSANFAAAPQAKSRGPAMAAVGLLLVAALTAAGVYVVNPALFTGQKEVEKVPGTNTVVPPPANANAGAISNSNSTPDGSTAVLPAANTQAPPKVEPARPTENPTKPAEITKNKTPNPPERPNPVDDPELNNIHTAPDEVVITQRNPDGTTTRIMTQRGPNGRRMPNGQRPPDPMIPMPNGVPWKDLTPKQRQQVKNYMRNHGGMPPPGVIKP